MQNNAIISFIIGVLVGGIVVTWFQNIENPLTEPDISNNSFDDSVMHSGRGEHMEQMQQMFVTSEQAFIELMIPHHQEAIDTANEVLKRGGTTEEVRNLMNNIITAQTAEIESMREWYEIWYKEPYQDNGKYEPMMRELENLSGAEIDQAFLEDMIMHHMGAIMMARSVQPYVEHEEIAILTKNIVETQSAEIGLMRQMLTQR